MRRFLGAAVLAGSAAWTSSATTEDFTRLGDFSVAGNGLYSNCGVTVRNAAETGPDLLFSSSGIAIAGGDPAALDGGESVSLLFIGDSVGTRTVTQLSYRVAAVGDGDATAAELTLEAFDADDTSLGEVAFSGEGEHSISAAFGNAPIGRVTITSGDDPVVVQNIRYAFPSDTLITASLFDLGTFQTDAVFELCGVSFSGSNRLHFNHQNGVGVAGGLDPPDGDMYVDSGETLQIALAQPVPTVSYDIGGSLSDGNPVDFGVEAFDANGGSLGTTLVSSHTFSVVVSDLFPGQLISRFVIHSDPDGHFAQAPLQITFPAPEPGTDAAAGGVLIALGAIALRRARRLR